MSLFTVHISIGRRFFSTQRYSILGINLYLLPSNVMFFSFAFSLWFFISSHQSSYSTIRVQDNKSYGPVISLIFHYKAHMVCGIGKLRKHSQGICHDTVKAASWTSLAFKLQLWNGCQNATTAFWIFVHTIRDALKSVELINFMPAVLQFLSPLESQKIKQTRKSHQS